MPNPTATVEMENSSIVKAERCPEIAPWSMTVGCCPWTRP